MSIFFKIILDSLLGLF